MGTGKGPARVLITSAAALACAAASPSLPSLRDARWLQTPDLLADLTKQPSECRSHFSDQNRERSIEIGRIAFSDPLLLGGQAARAGLSCSACHSNGRTNVHFHFPGLSGAPGTADVTSSIMSSHRGDGIFNPKAIPDLAGDPAKLKVSRDVTRADLANFIHGLITQEFDGAEPPKTVLDGVVAYVRSLTPSSCRGPATTPITLFGFLDDVEKAVLLARDEFADGDEPTGRVLLGAARSTLGRIDERFEVPEGVDARRVLREASDELGQIERAETVTSASFDDWNRKWPGRVRLLRLSEPRSLFSEAMLRRELRAN
ncbi:MAG TPA: hypothetical protein VGU01_08930 [Sphingomicrobium sp.]|nr:hypothetical protein [Sphingomicrobium sp.]